MTKKNQHVVPHNGGWAVKPEGAAAPTATTRTQDEAIRIAREQARVAGTEVVIHRPDGRIRDRDSYGNDPNPPKDSRH